MEESAVGLTAALLNEQSKRLGLGPPAAVIAAGLRRGRGSGRARPSWGRGGAGRRGAGPPALGSASDCGAAGRCVITMARSLCLGAWLRKPYYLQVGRRRPSPAQGARSGPRGTACSSRWGWRPPGPRRPPAVWHLAGRPPRASGRRCPRPQCDPAPRPALPGARVVPHPPQVCPRALSTPRARD